MKHGAGAPQVRAANARRVQLGAAADAVESLGLRRDIGPAAALAEAIQRKAGDVAYLGDRLAPLPADELVIVDLLPGNGTRTVLNPLVELYQAAVRDLSTIGRAAASAGVEERRQALAEAMAVQLVAAIRTVLDALNLTPEQQVLVGPAVSAAAAAITQGE